MRYTRTKQLVRLTGGKYWEYMPNVKVDEMRKLLSDYELDKSFKWHRDFEGWGENWVEFGGDEYSYGELIKSKGKNLHLK